LGRDLVLDPMPEPLMAPGENQAWRLLWSSEAPPYGGAGISPLELGRKPLIPGHAAIILAANAIESRNGAWQ
jgi:maltooligosyltrehalose trehalohydrolase